MTHAKTRPGVHGRALSWQAQRLEPCLFTKQGKDWKEHSRQHLSGFLKS